MPNINNEDPNFNPNNLISSIPERPPLLKKSRTIADDSRPPHFPGPLFPAVRRVSISPPTPPSSMSSSPSSAASTTSTSSFSDQRFGVSDRDYVYPSFLGPYSSRTRVTVKATAKSLKREVPVANSPARSASMPSNLNTLREYRAPPDLVLPEAKPKAKLKQERDLKSVPVQVLATSLSSPVPTSDSPSIARRRGGFSRSLILNLLTFVCILSVSYAISLQSKVTQLQEDNVKLHRLCSQKDIVYNDIVGVLESQNENSFVYFGNTDSRSIALYTVLFTLLTPFVLYKFLDYLPRIKNLSKTSKDNKEEVPLKKRIAYMVDVCFSVYPYAKLLALLFATIFLIGFGGLALYGVSDGSFAEALWLSWSFVADSGNHADRVGTGPRIVSVSISSGGMLIFAMMLGLVSDAISEKVDSLRKGKSEVIESNHILILGWSDKLGSLLKQLAIANKSIGGGVIVVLAERDKEDMEMDIAKFEFDFMGTSVICRSGSPLILADLKKVSVSKARAIIVLASDENADQSDAHALRVVLSLTGVKEGLRGHVVVEMSDLDNEPLVKLVGGELIETVVAHDVIGRLMIQCALQPGLAQIWEDILGFENAEFYIKRWPQLDGLCFKDVLISFPDAIPCGIKVAADGGKIFLNPDDKYVLKEGDEVLVIAEDDDTYAPGTIPEVRRGLCPKITDPPKFPEKILFCGWRRDIDDMIMVLEAFLAPGSELWMFNEVPEKEREKKLTDGGLDIGGLVNIKLVHREGNAVIRRHLENLPLETFDSILILADESVEDSIVHSDSRSLATLLLIRDIQSKRLPFRDRKSMPLRHSGFSHSSWIREMQQASDKSIIISEILDSRTRNLVSVTRISDYVLSNELVSMALAMVAEDKQINRVLEELFAEEVGAIEGDEELTPLGYHLAKLPVDVLIGKMMLYGGIFGCLSPILSISVFLSYKSPFVYPKDERQNVERVKLSLLTDKLGGASDSDEGNRQSDHLVMMVAYRKWEKILRENGVKSAQRFCSSYFLSSSVLYMIRDMRIQFGTLLADIGLISLPKTYQMDGKRKEILDDWFSDMSAPFNMHSNHSSIVKAILCEGLYPNVAAMEEGIAGTALGSLKQSVGSSIHGRPVWYDGKREVHIHPSSVNSNSKAFQYPFLVFLEKVETSKVFLRDTTIISPYSILLFGGSINLHNQTGIVTIDGWLKLAAPARTAVLFKELRLTLHSILKELIRKPQTGMIADNEVMKSIIHLLLEEDK